MAKIRLFIDHPLVAGQPVPVDGAQAHYLSGVMRLRQGDAVSVFNGRDGEWQATLLDAGKARRQPVGGRADRDPAGPAGPVADLAPIKKARTDFIVEKAAEMGAARIMPVQTDHTNSDRIRQDRLQAHAIEAAEQCGGTFVPPVADLAPLSRVAGRVGPGAAHPVGGRIPRRASRDAGGAAAGPLGHPDRPRGRVFPPPNARGWRACPSSRRSAWGPRILRADTAAVAALALWQSALGDWR